MSMATITPNNALEPTPIIAVSPLRGSRLKLGVVQLVALDRKRGRLDCSRFRFLVVAALVVANVVYHPVVATEAF